MSSQKKLHVLVVGGPTASGKSGFALALAERLNGTVINCDSMQIYNGLPLLTAQPSQEECARAEHALYAILDPSETCSAALWREKALHAIQEAHEKNKLPIITGGTGFYINALMKGLSPIPEIDPTIREALIAKQIHMGQEAFFNAFATLDPAMAEKLDPHNVQRVTRAWEVLEGTGKSLAEWQALPPIGAPDHLSFTTMVLLPDREKLYDRCNLRFEQMLDEGALDEVDAFRSQYPAEPKLSLHNALGYYELCDYIDGKTSKEEAIAKSQQSTRNYAKRQMTWFKNQIAHDLTVTSPKEQLEQAETLITSLSFNECSV